jgi:glycosyltransferase involved in cell wall biosynthesis
VVFIDLHLYTNENSDNETDLFDKYKSNINYVYCLSDEIKPIFIQHAGFETDFNKGNVRFIVKRGNQRKYNTFIKLFFVVKAFAPHVVMMHSMLSPINIILAKLIFGKQVKIIVQNHAEKPTIGLKGIAQKAADFFISNYLFVSKIQAHSWIECGIIKNMDKIVEVMEGSTDFKAKDYSLTDMNDGHQTHFIWVGRLDTNKDPITILEAFARFIKIRPESRLKMIYGTAELIGKATEFIKQKALENFVELLGYVENAQLEKYYNSADYFILGSHHEGSGYALCEAMACGCVPIVTNIPSFSHMLDKGACGYLFEPGNSEDLYKTLIKLNNKSHQEFKKATLAKFRKDLSFEAIGLKISKLSLSLANK